MLGGQQSEVDSLNVLGNQIMQCNDENIRSLVRKHLHGLNDNWQRVKEKALAEQPLFVSMPMVDELAVAKDISRGWKIEEDFLPDDHLRYQVLFSDVFDWLVRCEESIRTPFPNNLDFDKFEKLSSRYLVRLLFIDIPVTSSNVNIIFISMPIY